MKNRVRQSRTLGSVRGEDGAGMVNLHGHAAGNGGYGQGDTYSCDRSSPTRSCSALLGATPGSHATSAAKRVRGLVSSDRAL